MQRGVKETSLQVCELTALPRLGCEVVVTHPPLPAPSAPLLVLSSGLQPLLHRFCPRVLLRARPAAAALPPEPLVAAGLFVVSAVPVLSAGIV